MSQWKWVYFRSGYRKLAHFDLIERASRGPLGSLLMIARVNWSMATLGAVVIIVTLGIDTFTQQVISLETTTSWVSGSTNSSSFGISHNYHSGAKGGYLNLGFPFTYSRSSP